MQITLFQDFGGGASIHIMGGTIALITTILLSPRPDRLCKSNFDNIGGQITPVWKLKSVTSLFSSY